MSSSTSLINQALGENLQITSAEAAILVKQAELEAAYERLNHTYILAPFDGIITKRAVQKGQYVNQGQTLGALINHKDLWVTANFKETQLNKIRIGQTVGITIDTQKNIQLKGSIASYDGATGSRFALLPLDNATGNNPLFNTFICF